MDYRSSACETYDGYADPVEFINSFKFKANGLKWDQELQAKQIALLLREKAKDVYESLEASKKKEMAEVEKILVEKCGPSKEALTKEFHTRTPKQGESLVQFGRVIQDLLVKSTPSLSADDQVKHLKNKLCQFLPEGVQLSVQLMSGPWSEILSNLERVQLSVPTQFQQFSSSSFSFGAATSNLASSDRIKTEPLDLNAINAQQRRKFNGNCRYCNRFGHREVECYKKRNDLARQRHQADAKPSRNQSSKYESHSRKPKGASANTIDLDGNRKHDDDDDGDYNDRDSNTLSVELNTKVLDLNLVSTRAPLIARDAYLRVDSGYSQFKLSALFDGGATNTFVRFSALPAEIQAEIDVFLSGSGPNSLGLKGEYLNIKGATGSSSEYCALLSAHVEIGNWYGRQEFIVSKSLSNKEIILGRDFLKANNVQINHGTDSIRINHPSEPKIEVKPNPSRCNVYTYNITVEPRVEALVKCKTDAKPGEDVLFSPSASESGVFWSNCVTRVNDKSEILVRVVNLNERELKLSPNQLVGEVSTDFELFSEDGVEANTAETGKTAEVSKSVNNDVLAKLEKFSFGPKLSVEQKQRVSAMLVTKLDAFQWDPNDVGRTDLVKHKIDTGNSEPIRKKQFKIPHALRSVMDNMVKELQDQKMIEPSASPWCSPVMVVKQTTRDGKAKYRFITDMRALNSVTVKDAYPLARMDQALESLGGSAYFTVVDMARGFYQVALDEDSKPKTAFSANGKLWQWTVMPLGLCNAPSTFTRLMELVLHGINSVYCLVYLDDTIIYSRTFDEHLVHVNTVLDRITKAKLKLRPDKCVFASDRVNYLGYVVSREGISPDPDKVKTISEIPFPKTAKGLVRFLGAVNFYRDFIEHFSDVASVLYKMSQSEAKFKAKLKSKSADIAFKAFEKLKELLVAEPVLIYPNFKQEFVIQTDASAIALGAVLGQYGQVKGKNAFRPIMYGSRHLTKTEMNYSTTDRELLAIVWASKKFKAYIYARPVTFITDHQALATMRSLKEPMGRTGRLLNHIQDIDYKIVYQPGASNYTADWLSRPESTPEREKELNTIQIQLNSTINWPVEQNDDAVVKRVIELVKERDNVSPNSNSYANKESWKDLKDGMDWFRLKDKLFLANDVLMLNDSLKVRPVVPAKLIKIILEFHHDQPLAGHRDFERTFASIKERYFWINMHKEVKEYCATCHLCQTKKYISRPARAPLKPIHVSEPWSIIGLDVAGPLKSTISGNKFIIVAIDYFTKFCVAKAVPDSTAETTARFVFEEIVCKFGAPKAIISDCGPNFKAELFKKLCVLCDIKTANSSFYHHEANGLAERMIKSMKQIVTMYISDNHSNWDVLLQPAISAYNTAFHASIKCSPYEALFARKATSLADVLLRTPVSLEGKTENYVSMLRENAYNIKSRIKQNLDEAHKRQKIQYDKLVRDSQQFKVGDLVLLVNERSIAGESKSFKPRAVGPYRILAKFNDVNYKLESLVDKSTQTAHYNRLKWYNARPGANFGPRLTDLLPRSFKLDIAYGEKKKSDNSRVKYTYWANDALQPPETSSSSSDDENSSDSENSYDDEGSNDGEDSVVDVNATAQNTETSSEPPSGTSEAGNSVSVSNARQSINANSSERDSQSIDDSSSGSPSDSGTARGADGRGDNPLDLSVGGGDLTILYQSALGVGEEEDEEEDTDYLGDLEFGRLEIPDLVLNEPVCPFCGHRVKTIVGVKIHIGRCHKQQANLNN